MHHDVRHPVTYCVKHNLESAGRYLRIEVADVLENSEQIER